MNAHRTGLQLKRRQFLQLDDFFRDEPGGEVGSLTVDQLRDIQRQIKGPGKKMDMYVTFYACARL